MEDRGKGEAKHKKGVELEKESKVKGSKTEEENNHKREQTMEKEKKAIRKEEEKGKEKDDVAISTSNSREVSNREVSKESLTSKKSANLESREKLKRSEKTDNKDKEHKDAREEKQEEKKHEIHRDENKGKAVSEEGKNKLDKKDAVDRANAMAEIKEDRKTDHKKKRGKKRRKPTHGLWISFLIIVIIGAGLSALLIYLNSSRSILASVNGDKITFDEIKNIVLRIPLKGFNESIFRKIIEYKINETLLKQLAQKEGIVVNESLVNEIYQQKYVALFGSEAQLEVALAAAGFTKRDILESIRSQLRQAMLIEKLFSNVTVSDEEIKKFYEENENKIKFFYYAFMNRSISNLSEIKEDLRVLLIQNKRNKAFEGYLGDYYNKSDIKIYEKNIKKYYKIARAALKARLSSQNLVNYSGNSSGNGTFSSPSQTTESEGERKLIGNRGSALPTGSNNISNYANKSEEESLSYTENQTGSNTSSHKTYGNETPNNHNASDEANKLNEETLRCITNQGYEKKDVIVILSNESETYKNVKALEKELSGFSFKDVDINSESFLRLSNCLQQQINYLPTFICLKDGSMYDGKLSSMAVKESMASCSGV